jgi:hypothetical protein
MVFKEMAFKDHKPKHCTRFLGLVQVAMIVWLEGWTASIAHEHLLFDSGKKLSGKRKIHWDRAQYVENSLEPR